MDTYPERRPACSATLLFRSANKRRGRIFFYRFPLLLCPLPLPWVCISEGFGITGVCNCRVVFIASCTYLGMHIVKSLASHFLLCALCRYISLCTMLWYWLPIGWNDEREKVNKMIRLELRRLPFWKLVCLPRLWFDQIWCTRDAYTLLHYQKLFLFLLLFSLRVVVVSLSRQTDERLSPNPAYY